MRITQNTLFTNLRAQLQGNTSRLLSAQEQVASQKKINRLSDNPVDGGRILDLNSSIAQSTQYLSNIERTSSASDLLDTTFDQANTIISRAKELLLKETNEVTSTSTTREATRTEISILTSQMVQLANTRYDGNYIFSGFQTATQSFNEAAVAVTPAAVTGGATVTAQDVIDPTKMTYHNYSIQFTAPGQFDIIDTTSGSTLLANQTYTSGQDIQFDGMSITLSNSPGTPLAGDTYTVTTTSPGQFQGDNQIQFIEIQAGTKVPINTTGDRVFKGVGISGGVDIFDTLNQINDALRNNDQTQMNALLDQLGAAQTQISNERSINGARANLLDDVKEHQTDIQSSLKILSSNLEDVDVADAMILLQKQQDTYDATLSAAAKIVQNSLLDFLR
jgi:flagellar hook-associated protein 3 FlgL